MNGLWLNSHAWTENTPHGPLGPKGEARFQAEIDRRVGVETDGTHRFLLAWGQKYEVFNQTRGEWHLFLMADAPKRDFKANAAGIIEPCYRIIGAPRYMLMGWSGSYTPIANQRDRWVTEGSRTIMDNDGKIHVEENRVLLRAMPKYPQYRLELVYAKHIAKRNPDDPLAPCCVEKLQQGKQCFGWYVQPDETDLADISREMEWQMEQFKEAPSAAISQAKYAWLARQEVARREQEAQSDAENAEYVARHESGTIAGAMQAAAGERKWSLPPTT